MNSSKKFSVSKPKIDVYSDRRQHTVITQQVSQSRVGIPPPAVKDEQIENFPRMPLQGVSRRRRARSSKDVGYVPWVTCSPAIHGMRGPRNLHGRLQDLGAKTKKD